MVSTRSATRLVSNASKPPAHATSSSTTSSTPPKTPDGHYIIVNNRRWRATDPSIPPDRLAELKHYLGLARSALRGARNAKTEAELDRVQHARQQVAAAKLGLGERGKPEWWNDTSEGRRERWQDALRALRELGE